MSKKRSIDSGVLRSLSELLIASMPIFPKKLLGSDALQRKFSIPSSQLQIMSLLLQGTMSVSELSNRMSTAKPNITPLIDHLAKLGYVERVRDNEDRRVVNISITESGREFMDSVCAELQSVVEEWASELSPAELKKLINGLSDVVSVMQKIK